MMMIIIFHITASQEIRLCLFHNDEHEKPREEEMTSWSKSEMKINLHSEEGGE